MSVKSEAKSDHVSVVSKAATQHTQHTSGRRESAIDHTSSDIDQQVDSLPTAVLNFLWPEDVTYVYTNFRARGELPRLVAAYGGIDYVDKRIADPPTDGFMSAINGESFL